MQLEVIGKLDPKHSPGSDLRPSELGNKKISATYKNFVMLILHSMIDLIKTGGASIFMLAPLFLMYSVYFSSV